MNLLHLPMRWKLRPLGRSEKLSRHPDRSQRIGRGFTVVELLVVLGIIVVLLGILLPIFSRVRESSRATACLANVQQWAYAYQMYAGSNRGRSLGILHSGDDQHWWEMLAPFLGDVHKALLCPDAREIRDDPPPPGPNAVAISRGSAVLAWVYRSARLHTFGSYGFNYALSELGTPQVLGNFFFGRVPIRDAPRVPLMCECVYPWADYPFGNGGPPLDLADPGPCQGVTSSCIDRHLHTVNVAFVDGHAERVQLGQLWHLKWYPDFHESDVSVP